MIPYRNLFVGIFCSIKAVTHLSSYLLISPKFCTFQVLHFNSLIQEKSHFDQWIEMIMS